MESHLLKKLEQNSRTYNKGKHFISIKGSSHISKVVPQYAVIGTIEVINQESTNNLFVLSCYK